MGCFEEAVGEDPTAFGFRCCLRLCGLEVLSVVIWKVVVRRLGRGQCLFG